MNEIAHPIDRKYKIMPVFFDFHFLFGGTQKCLKNMVISLQIQEGI